MRFDDRLKTALLQPRQNGARANIQWAQLIDLLSQNPTSHDINIIADGLHRLRELMMIVPEESRISGVQLVMGRLQSIPLLQLLAGDTPMVALSAIRGAKFSDEQWSKIIPLLPTRSRGFLRNRDDLGPKAMQSLAVWASADFILPSLNASNNNIPPMDHPINSVDAINTNEPNRADEALSSFILGDNIIEVDESLIVSGERDDAEDIQITAEFKADANDRRQRIDEIVEKIESLRSSRETLDAPQLPLQGGIDSELSTVKEIYFSTDSQGTIDWVDGVPRGALVGTSLSEPSYDGCPGPDASGAAAFKQRITLDNARMKLCGPEMIDGDWRINAAPFFDIVNGRFKGYKGLLRRPNILESAGVDNLYTDTFAHDDSDNLQQLIHELRTPLGAVIGFAEIIEQQLFGPASSEYRVLAKTILDEGNRLLSGFDDLNVAAKIDAGSFQASLGQTDCGWLIEKVSRKLTPLVKSQGANLIFSETEKLKPLMIENDDAERLFVRLLSALIMASSKDEQIIAHGTSITLDRPINQFTVTLPNALRGMNEQELFESGPERNEDNNKAPLLGLGFSLRLVRNLTNNIGGNLVFHSDNVTLNLPAARENATKNLNNIE